MAKRGCAIKLLSVITAALMAAACLVMPAHVLASADFGEYTNYISSVSLKGGRIAAEIRLTDSYVSEHAGEKIRLLALPAYEEKLLPEYEIGSADVSAKPKIRADGDASYVNYKFIAVSGEGGELSPVTGYAYIGNVKDSAKYRSAFPDYASVKGLSFGEPDAPGLAAMPSHTVVDVDLCDIMLGSRKEGAVETVSRGVSYYYDGEAVGRLDRLVSLYTDAGVCVYFRILLSDRMMNGALRFLYAADKPGDGARYYAPDMSDEECCKYLEAFFGFIAERYAPGGERGFAASYIIGTDVNSNRSGCYYGPCDIAAYTANYAALLRLAYNTVCSVYGGSRVFVPIGGNFNAKTADLRSVGDDSLDYSAKDFLTELNAKISSEGNFRWDVAADGSPSDGRTDLRADSNALFSDDTLFVTMRNIEVLESFISRGEFLCGKEKRRIIIDRFALSSENESSGELLQAAVYAYACCKAAGLGYIDALIYSEYRDGEQSRGLIRADGEPKAIYDTLKFIDSDEKYKISDAVPAYLGAQSWNELGVERGAPEGAYSVGISEPAAIGEVGRKLYGEQVFAFSDGDRHGFDAGVGMSYTELAYDSGADSPVLRAFAERIGTGEHAALYARDLGLKISTGKYLSMRLKADSDRLSGVLLTVRLYGSTTGGKTVVCECESRLKCSVWSDVCFDISDLAAQCGRIDRAEIIMGADGASDGGSAELSLSSVTLYSSTSRGAYNALIWAALVLFVAAVGAAIGRNLYVSRRRRGRQIKFDI